MINRFKAYIDKTFKILPYTREAMELREEILAGLMERAEELKAENLSDDEIFVRCIDSLGDYTEAINALKKHPFAVFRDAKFLRLLLSILSFALCSVITYILCGVLGSLWGKAALIIFPSMGIIIYFMVTASILRSNIKLRKHLTSGVIIASYFAIYVVAMFFILWAGVGLPAKFCWVVFPYISAFAILAHMITMGYLRKKKIWLVAWIAFIMCLSVAVYLTAAMITGMWHPLWIIILIAAVASVLLCILKLNKAIEVKSELDDR